MFRLETYFHQQLKKYQEGYNLDLDILRFCYSADRTNNETIKMKKVELVHVTKVERKVQELDEATPYMMTLHRHQ